jgi:hypothetical protein
MEDYSIFIDYENLTVIRPEKLPEPDILTQLRTAKQGAIETLKSPKSVPSNVKSQIEVKPVKIREIKTHILLKTDSFLDNIGNLKSIHSDILQEFNIDKLNLINTKVVNRDYFDLENLYYYISILRMLNLECPFNSSEIIKILGNFVNNWAFSSSKDVLPDVINNFFGLAIVMEFDLIKTIDFIDLQEIDNLVVSGLINFIPEKLHLNLFSLLCLKLINILLKKSIVRDLNLASISKLNLLSIENFKPIIDIYSHLVILKLLKMDDSIDNLRNIYFNEIKKNIKENGSINGLVSETARALLIISLFNFKEQEPDLCTNLLNFILKKTKFFSIDNIDKNFNWRNDRLGFKIELEMLYWSLLASSEFTPKDY